MKHMADAVQVYIFKSKRMNDYRTCITYTYRTVWISRPCGGLVREHTLCGIISYNY